MSKEMGCPVKVYVYDMSKGMARSLSQALLGKRIDGIWHTGIVVYGQEFSFGTTGGIDICRPGGTILGSPDSIEDMGITQVPYELFRSYLNQLATSTFGPNTYHLLEHNCNAFSKEVCLFLTGKDIPSKITDLPADILSTPFGQIMKPWIDAMQPRRGHAVFPINLSGASSGTAGAEEGQTRKKSARNGPATECEKTMSDDCAEPEDTKEEAVPALVFTEKPLDRKQFQDQIFHKLPMKDLGLVTDIYDYLSEGDNPSWSLGKDHVQTLHTVIGDGSVSESARTCVCTILQSLILRTDFLALIQREPTQLVLKIMEQFEQIPEAVQGPFIKMLTNCCSTEPGHKFLTSIVDSNQESDQTFLTTGTKSVQTDMLKWTIQTCVSCLLKDKVSINECGSSLAFNLSRYKLSDDTQVEIGSALLECLQREPNEKTEFNLLFCLLKMMDSNTEHLPESAVCVKKLSSLGHYEDVKILKIKIPT